MSIPLDRLYKYVEDISEEIHGDRVLIYRFWPHGSKKIDDLTLLTDCTKWYEMVQCPEVYCNDQEPLDWQYYQSQQRDRSRLTLHPAAEKQGVVWQVTNFRRQQGSIWDKALLLHSEQNSADVELYSQSRFIPVYYWTHAVLALDWFRYGQHVSLPASADKKLFLVYNRSWSGSREYRLKFSDFLIENDLVRHCRTWANSVDPETNTHYSQHDFEQDCWRPRNQLETFFTGTKAAADSSADFDVDDYKNTHVEVVLETLFDRDKIHLTEKTLRPIALGLPFILCAPSGSLAYLRSYGFKTFDPIIDESYDTICDHQQRLQSVVKTMKKIREWSAEQRHQNLQQLDQIAQFNKQHFFSAGFSRQVLDELKINLQAGFEQLYNTNTSKFYLDYRLATRNDPTIFQLLQTLRTEQEAWSVFKQAQYYYLRSLTNS